MKLTKFNQLKNGLKINCKIDGRTIKNATVLINPARTYIEFDNERHFLCLENEDIEDWTPYIKDLEAIDRNGDDNHTAKGFDPEALTLEEEVEEIKLWILNTETFVNNDLEKALDRYYQARKTLENLKNNNQ